MLKLIIFVYVGFLLNLFGIVDNKGIQIDLIRQKSPHESILNTNNIPSEDVYLDWLKPRPKHLNVSNISIALKRYLDSEFYGVVKLGSKNQTFNVVYDTAWTTSWFVSELCPDTMIGCKMHNKYDHRHSASYTRDGEKYVVNEGAYNLSGFYSKDHINVGGSKILDFCFVEMDYIPKVYLFTKADGVLGLSLPYGNQKTFLMRLLEQGTIKKPMFSIYLNRNPHSNRGGVIMLGAYDKKHIHRDPKHNPEKFVYVPVIDDGSGLWKFALDGIIMVVSKIDQPICSKNCQGFIDSESTSIIASKKEVDAINDLINAKRYLPGQYTVDCDTVNILPKINFIISGHNFTLSGNQYIKKVTIDETYICISAFSEAETPSERGWVIGGAFLAQYFSTYDMEKKQIGFVRAA